MKGKVFIDTNVLIYLFSTDEPEKRIHCNKLLSSLEKDHVMVWSTQVVQEFYNTLTRKLGVSPLKLKSYFSYFGSFELVVNNMTTINTAIDIQINNQLTFWDSLIVSAAHQANCSTLLSEDLTHSQKIDTLTIQNPFELGY
ncbi:PIN domain-containing protein [Marinoscillum sp. 108]|uniref:PIN domain-containing protein n=1 Tax=Marinoscillum luteum TaxID=861051 RepID=A0ABW7N9Z6_9BACT|nr:PIN domain-containing protein [Marinoscillum sp. 108]